MPTVIVVRTNRSRAEARAIVRRFADGLRTKAASPHKAILGGYIAAEVLRENADDFDQKAQGRADRFGDVWQPLAAYTIARKLRKIGRLTSGQRRARWDNVYRLMLQQFGQRLKPKAAAEAARRIAWQAVSGPVFINIDTWRLRRSLQWTDALKLFFVPATDQIARIDRNRLEIGTAVPYAKYTHRGTRRQPARPILASSDRIRGWVRQGVANSRMALAQALGRELR